MKKRLLGNTGIKVSEVAFGGAGIGMPYADQPMPSESESIRLLQKAAEYGINFFDTARMYGKSEYLMGKAFKSMRSDVILSSKCVHFLDENGKIPPRSVLEKKIRKSLEKSLQALQTDYIDLYMLHQANINVLDESSVAEVFSSLKKEGKIRAMGASTYLLSETERCIDSSNWDVVQLPFNLLDQKQRRYFEKAEEGGMGIVIRSVLFRGMLSGRPLELHPALKEVGNHIKKYDQLIGENWPDLVTLAAKFVLSYNTVSSALIGIDKMEHLNKAVRVTGEKYLNADALSDMEAMAYPDPNFLNLHQWNKKGWLQN